MKYNILINQKAIVESGLNIDLVDAAILNYISDFSNTDKIMKFHHEGNTYYWISYSHLSNEMPLLRNKKGKQISKDALYRRLKDMCKQDILKLHPNSRVLGKSYYSFGKMYSRLITDSLNKSEHSEINPKGIGNKSDGASEINPKNNTIKDNTIKNNNSKGENSIKYPFESKAFILVWEDWKQYKKDEFNFKYKSPKTEQAGLNSLKKKSGNNENLAIEILQRSIECGYRGFFEIKKDDKPLNSNGFHYTAPKNVITAK